MQPRCKVITVSTRQYCAHHHTTVKCLDEHLPNTLHVPQFFCTTMLVHLLTQLRQGSIDLLGLPAHKEFVATPILLGSADLPPPTERYWYSSVKTVYIFEISIRVKLSYQALATHDALWLLQDQTSMDGYMPCLLYTSDAADE